MIQAIHEVVTHLLKMVHSRFCKDKNCILVLYHGFVTFHENITKYHRENISGSWKIHQSMSKYVDSPFLPINQCFDQMFHELSPSNHVVFLTQHIQWLNKILICYHINHSVLGLCAW